MLLLNKSMGNSLSKKKKILIIKLGAIGDSIHATIIGSSIKLTHPDWQVDYLTYDFLGELLKDCPHFDNLIFWRSREKNKHLELMRLAKTLYKEHYDIIFNLTITLRNCILTILARPVKIVNKKEFNKSWIENFYLTAKQEIKDLNLPERLYLDVDRVAINKIRSDINIYKRPYFIVAPGGNSDRNRQGRLWNIDKWKELAGLLIENFGGTVFVCGGREEVDYHRKLEAENIILLTGKYTLSESSALFSMADLFISGDTGPLHIASAHNIKTLAILGSTSPDKIKPYGPNGFYIEPKSDCKYCWKKKCKFLKAGDTYTPCMESIVPQDVIDTIMTKILISNTIK